MSAKYKGAFCEAKVRSVIKEVKCRITFKGGLGSCTLSDEAIKPIDDQPIVQGVTVKAKHPDKQEYLDAIINQIKVRIRSVSLPEILLEPRIRLKPKEIQIVNCACVLYSIGPE